MALIEIKHLKKKFGDHEILKDVNLKVESGDILTIIGESGSGKSTIIRCLTGLESIDGGEISFTGDKIGMVFQNFNLFPHYTVKENISKPLITVQKLSEKEANEKAEELLRKVKLEKAEDQYPSTLSGGQKQRLAIARTLAMEPSVIAFDEPTSSLDPDLANEVFQLIRDLALEGQTMIIVTHQINAIRKIATKVAYLRDGIIEDYGSTHYIFEESDNDNLKKFLRVVEFNDL